MSERLEADDPVARKEIRAAGNRQETRRSPQDGDCTTDTLAHRDVRACFAGVESLARFKLGGRISRHVAVRARTKKSRLRVRTANMVMNTRNVD